MSSVELGGLCASVVKILLEAGKVNGTRASKRDWPVTLACGDVLTVALC